MISHLRIFLYGTLVTQASVTVDIHYGCCYIFVTLSCRFFLVVLPFMVNKDEYILIITLQLGAFARYFDSTYMF